jgi:predicted nucleotidyltransferase
VTGKDSMDKALRQISEKMTATFGDRLVSVILYGSAASGEYSGDYSDLNILCVLRAVSPRELQDAEPIFQWWRKQNNPAPLLLSADEVRTSTDCFSIEFHDMKEYRRVLTGEDVIAPLEIDDSFYRAQVEHELRAKLLRLRQKAAGASFDNEALGRLLAESVSTFCVLFRHALRLCGHPAPGSRKEIVVEAAGRFGFPPEPFQTVLRLRDHTQKPKDVKALGLLEGYIASISCVIDVVDALEK